MYIRRYQSIDLQEIIKLFFDTVHFINIKDYSDEQVNAWAPNNIDVKRWDESLLKNYSVVVIENDVIAGFGDIDESNYLDRLYVHKDYQSKGIATLICDELEQQANGNTILVVASITAKGFFEKRGYQVIKEQQIERLGILLTNYVMKK